MQSCSHITSLCKITNPMFSLCADFVHGKGDSGESIYGPVFEGSSFWNDDRISTPTRCPFVHSCVQMKALQWHTIGAEWWAARVTGATRITRSSTSRCIRRPLWTVSSWPSGARILAELHLVRSVHDADYSLHHDIRGNDIVLKHSTGKWLRDGIRCWPSSIRRRFTNDSSTCDIL